MEPISFCTGCKKKMFYLFFFKIFIFLIKALQTKFVAYSGLLYSNVGRHFLVWFDVVRDVDRTSSLLLHGVTWGDGQGYCRGIYDHKTLSSSCEKRDIVSVIIRSKNCCIVKFKAFLLFETSL